MPRTTSPTFNAALSVSPVKPIELVTITYKDSSLLNRTKQFAIWPEQVVLGRLIFQPRPYMSLDSYSVGLQEHPTTTVNFLDVDAQFRTEFSDAQKSIRGYPDLRGADVVVWKVLSDHLSSSTDTIKDSFKVSTFSANDEFVVLSCDTPVQTPPRSFPPYVFTRKICQWTFKDPLTCKWRTGQGGSATSCTKVLEGTGGCKDHRNTANFGAYPSIADEEINASGG